MSRVPHVAVAVATTVLIGLVALPGCGGSSEDRAATDGTSRRIPEYADVPGSTTTATAPSGGDAVRAPAGPAGRDARPATTPRGPATDARPATTPRGPATDARPATTPRGPATAVVEGDPPPDSWTATCPTPTKSALGCRAVRGRVLAIQSYDPDGDGDLHVIAVGGDVTGPGITVFDVRASLRPKRDPVKGEYVTGAGPVFRGSLKQRQIQVDTFRVWRP